MSWKSEAKAIKQSQYGSYCNICIDMQKMPIPYHNFTEKNLLEIKVDRALKNIKDAIHNGHDINTTHYHLVKELIFLQDNLIKELK